MPAMVQPKQAQKIKFKILGKPAAFNTKKPEAYKKSEISAINSIVSYIK
jgi:hypothetical protein